MVNLKIVFSRVFLHWTWVMGHGDESGAVLTCMRVDYGVDVDEVVGKIERNGARRRLARSYDEHMARRRMRHMDWSEGRSSHREVCLDESRPVCNQRRGLPTPSPANSP